ncbi:hypothetical protein ADK90_36590 [Streptomyces sp. XY413]|uniref:hypothetical protein n=1 Tax=Streptomyces sp. XY413 TaxID=1519479 RepID=UPI0006ADE10B|nr:hypothetical protein [Streptomyces sp. XY413]KOV13789.1 hypothetical protein ADK90_36590 [Streptomyces sp. XY413]
MSPQREIDEETAAGRLALYVVALTRGATVRDLADRFGRSSSSWGNYLNGAQLIPKPLLGKLVEAFTSPGTSRSSASVQALELWNAAAAERHTGRPPGGGELVRQHQRRDDALQQVIKYQALAANAEKHLAELRPMLAYTQSRLENAELQLNLGGERERARVERQLGQAKERLSRVHVQQERARTRRMTAEEQQEFWMAEALVAQEEISRLEREAQDLVVVTPGSLEPVRTDTADAVDDSDFEARLEHITAEGLHDEALIEEDLQPTPTSPDDAAPQERLVAENPVQPLSNTEQAVLQTTEHPTSHDEAALAAPDSPDSLQLVSKMALDKPLTSTDMEQTAPNSPTRSPQSRAPRSGLRSEAADATRAAPATRNLWWGTRAALWLGLVEVKTAPTTAVGASMARAPAPVDLWFRHYFKTPLAETLSAYARAWRRFTRAMRRTYPDFKFTVGMILLGMSVVMYLIGQSAAASHEAGTARLADVAVGLPFCLAPLYGGMRLVTMANTPAWILAGTVHLVWSVLLVFDLFPWPAIGIGTK